jgi:hypothetical protein
MPAPKDAFILADFFHRQHPVSQRASVHSYPVVTAYDEIHKPSILTSYGRIPAAQSLFACGFLLQLSHHFLAIELNTGLRGVLGLCLHTRQMPEVARADEPEEESTLP